MELTGAATSPQGPSAATGRWQNSVTQTPTHRVKPPREGSRWCCWRSSPCRSTAASRTEWSPRARKAARRGVSGGHRHRQDLETLMGWAGGYAADFTMHRPLELKGNWNTQHSPNYWLISCGRGGSAEWTSLIPGQHWEGVHLTAEVRGWGAGLVTTLFWTAKIQEAEMVSSHFTASWVTPLKLRVKEGDVCSQRRAVWWSI